MPGLLRRPEDAHAPNGLARPLHVTPESAGWQYVSFALYRLQQGEQFTCSAGGQDTAVVLLSGTAEVSIDGQASGSLGGRVSVFDETPATTIYLAETASCQVRCVSSHVELAMASAPGNKRGVPPRIVHPEDVSVERRGEGHTQRLVKHLLDADQKANRLLVVEVATPAGNWSSFPPHKHDTEDPPREAYLEEVYYHRLDPEDGFAFQRVYAPGGLDETIAVHDGDLVLVPGGYHVVAVPPGYQNYYLNVMAGPNRDWLYQVDPRFRRLLPASGQISGERITRK